MTQKSDKEPMKKAVALQYKEDEQSVPEVVAKGFGDLADDIIRLAEESGVLVHRDTELSDFLARLDLGQQIPEELYLVIAELIAFSYVLQGKAPKNWQGEGLPIDESV